MTRKIAVLAILVAACGAIQVRADDVAVAARQTLEQYKNAVVTLRLTLNATNGGRTAELKHDTIATFIDASGLAVTAATNTGGSRIQIAEANFRLADGTEIPAHVVLKDDDLDLAYIAPETPLTKENSAKIMAVPLTDPAMHVQLLDQYFLIARTGQKDNFESSLGVGRILGKLTKPRVAYLADEQAMGCPAFDTAGKLIGICTRPSATNFSPVILPVVNITRNLDDAKAEMNKPVAKNDAASEPASPP